MDFPQLDYADVTSGDPVRQSKFATELVKSFETFGFASIINHDVPEETIKECFQYSRKFFALPHETKMLSKHPQGIAPRGYSFVGQENLSSLTRADRNMDKYVETKESWDQGAPNDIPNPTNWAATEAIPGFRDFMEKMFNTMHDFEERLLVSLAVGLGLPATHFDLMHTDRVNEFRLLHYPEVKVKDILAPDTTQRTRASEHTDFGSLTLLFQDSVGGLEVEAHNQPGTFYPIKAASPAMIINIGDSMQRWTNDRLRSTCHRVTVPPAMRKASEDGTDDAVIPSRYSIVFFGKPNRDVSLYPFPQFMKSGTKYPDITAGEYNHLRVITTQPYV
ncbi:Thymine dioxygenase [Lasiodiplodia theobromae]|uniref:Thymine dioxygenase n=1 Tax=Lasiodiplodia theobromae TaxID=45133 RepID=UPI0015C3DDAE|nr:Thymine dioxygenase [Lasiodiplodia theobromae]KAF4537159.1 Thymine dioxygenase [Lasiodiplodia theobromae]